MTLVRTILLGFSSVILMTGSGCARGVPAGNTPSMSDMPTSSGMDGAESNVQRGHASYYADRFAGRRTSSGEPYDPEALTAAHRTLPLGTIVEVTRPDGRSVRVRVNDRGPYGPHGRIIDLSRRAANAIGMIRDGVVEVTVRVVEEQASQARRDLARR